MHFKYFCCDIWFSVVMVCLFWNTSLHINGVTEKSVLHILLLVICFLLWCKVTPKGMWLQLEINVIVYWNGYSLWKINCMVIVYVNCNIFESVSPNIPTFRFLTTLFWWLISKTWVDSTRNSQLNLYNTYINTFSPSPITIQDITNHNK